MSDSERLDKLLQKVLAREVPEFKSLISCHQLTAGASQETYCITCRGTEGEFKLALRRSHSAMDQPSSVGGIALSEEARLLMLATQNGIPSPEIRYQLRAEDGLGDGFLMSWLEGETLGHRINRSPDLAEARSNLARQCGEILASIHAIDWRKSGVEEALEVCDTETLVTETWQQYQALQVPLPMIDYTARWLLENLPQQHRTTLVHGDFRNGNLMINRHGVEAVLDWELAHLGDPIQDLGWLCVNSWRFGNTDNAVGGFGHVEDLLAGYQSVSGVSVSLSDLKFWQVYGSFWWSVATLRMAQSWRTGETPSLERPVIGRRSSEAQMDCVNLIIPDASIDPVESKSIDEGQQLPMPGELLSGVADFLKKTVAPQLDSHASFLAKVAANSLAIAQREFLYGAELQQLELSRLQRLTDVVDNLEDVVDDLEKARWSLVDSIRGDLPLDTPGLMEHLARTVAGQLMIDQPDYTALKSN